MFPDVTHYGNSVSAPLDRPHGGRGKSVSAASSAAGIARLPRLCASLLLPSGRADAARPIILRTNADTERGKCSRLYNFENHSQKELYKCESLWYLHISNNSCY